MLTWILIGSAFVVGVLVYAYMVYKERQEQEALSHSFDRQVDSLLGDIHKMTDNLKSRLTPKPMSDFDRQLQEAMKDNP